MSLRGGEGRSDWQRLHFRPPLLGEDLAGRKRCSPAETSTSTYTYMCISLPCRGVLDLEDNPGYRVVITSTNRQHTFAATV